MSQDSLPRLAILDDYASIAEPKFGQLTTRLSITSFPDTLHTSEKTTLIDRLKPFTIISTMRERTPFPTDILTALPNLKLLLTTGTRNAAIDLPTCSKLGITVAGTTGKAVPNQGSQTSEISGTDDNIPAPSSTGPSSTTQHTWALLLSLARHIPSDAATIRTGGWQTSLALGLPGKTLSLLGLGKLGIEVAKIGVLAFNMKILAWSSNLTQEAADEKAVACGFQRGVFEVAGSKEELVKRADVLSVHYVLSPRSVGLLGAAELAMMKKSAILVNTSRGPLVDEAALLDVLKKGGIRGAALDVFATEPLPTDSEWRNVEWGRDGRSEAVLSPHLGYGEEGIMHRWYEETVENVERWLDGESLVNTMN